MRFVEVVRLFGHVELTACIVLLAEAAARADRVAARVARDAGPPLPGIRCVPRSGTTGVYTAGQRLVVTAAYPLVRRKRFVAPAVPPNGHWPGNATSSS